MAFHGHNEAEGYTQFEHLNDWACPRCFKRISATRPPVFNADNCSCDEVAVFHAGNAGHYSEPATYEHPLYNHETTAPYHNQAQSVASSTASFPSPEGPERETPDLQVGNAYLPLLEARSGLNERQHQRTASFHSDPSYTLQRFLGELKISTPAVYDTQHVGSSSPHSNFLSQEIHLQSSKKMKKKGSPHSKLSWMSESSRSGDASVSSWGMDPLAGAGMWDDRSGYGKTGNEYGYAMHLSGMSESAVFDDDDDDEMN